MKSRELSEILRVLADYVEKQREEDLRPLMEEIARVIKKPKKKADPVEISVSHSELEFRLLSLDSRAAGEQLLMAEVKGRKGLENLARHLQLPVQRDDKIEKLRAKIIENTIGSRLRSDAIQGKDRGKGLRKNF